MILISWQRNSQIASECVPGEEERGRMTAVQQWQPGRLHESQDEDRPLRQPWHQGEQPSYIGARVPSCLRRWCHISEPCQALFWYQSPPFLCLFLLPLDMCTYWKDRPEYVCMYAQDIQHQFSSNSALQLPRSPGTGQMRISQGCSNPCTLEYSPDIWSAREINSLHRILLNIVHFERNIECRFYIEDVYLALDFLDFESISFHLWRFAKTNISTPNGAASLRVSRPSEGQLSRHGERENWMKGNKRSLYNTLQKRRERDGFDVASSSSLSYSTCNSETEHTANIHIIHQQQAGKREFHRTKKKLQLHRIHLLSGSPYDVMQCDAMQAASSNNSLATKTLPTVPKRDKGIALRL